MKLLFDQNLSHRLPIRLADLFPDSAHVRLLLLDRASDTAIWDFALQYNYVIATQDSDFVDRCKLHIAPPKIVWLRCGNATPQRIEAILRSNAPLILELSQPNSANYAELF